MAYGAAAADFGGINMYWFLLVVSIVLAVCKSSLYNIYAEKETPALNQIFHFNTISYGGASIVALIGLLINGEGISGMTVLCAFFYAIIVAGLQTISITAMGAGAMSTTAICVMYGMIIPSVAGPIFWKESIGALQIVGIIIMIFSLWLIKGKTPDEGKGISKKWMILAGVAFVLSGMAGVMEKIHQSTEAREERMSFVFVACAFMFAFSLAARFITNKKKEAKTTKRIVLLAALSGLVIGSYSTVNLTLSGKLDSMIYYPIANGGAMLLTVFVSVIAFRERFDKTRIVGTVLGLLGILLLSIPV